MTALLATLPALSQQKIIWLNRMRTFEVERQIVANDSVQVHTGFRPLLESRIGGATNGEYVIPGRKYYYDFGLYTLRDHMVEITDENFRISLDIMFDLGANHDFNDTLNLDFNNFNIPATNTRGALLQGDIGEKFSFQSMLFETQRSLPPYLNDLADSLNVVPGEGRYKKLEGRKIDYNQSYGWMSWAMTPWLHITAGHGKHFIGNGYRSMLLSDGSYSYPFARTTLWLLDDKIQYQWMYAGLQTLERLPLGDVPESLFRKKSMSVSYLSISPIPQLELGLFESVIWQRWDSAVGTQPVNVESVIPIIGLNSGIHGMGALDHAVLGANGRWTTPWNGWIYGQFVTDGPAAGRYGYQLGAKFFDVLTDRLHVQLEYNLAEPGLFTHPYAHQEYSHFNQSLAHPSGTHFEEVIVGAYYQYKRWFLNLRQHYLDHAITSSGSILPGASDVGFETVPFIARSTVTSIELGALLNPKSNLNFTVGYQYRDQTRGGHVDVMNWVWFSWRTSIWNFYTDF